MSHPEPSNPPDRTLRPDSEVGLAWVWPVALATFVLAAGTGAAMRFGLVVGWPAGFGFADVRHAHSHLMYFGWVTPVLMALVAASLARSGVGLPGIRILLAGTFVAAFASYPAFLASGYRPATWLGVELPWSMMAAGLNGVAWVVFLGLYARAAFRPGARATERSRTVGAWLDAAAFLLASSLVGIAGLAGTAMGGLAEPRVTTALVELFLTWFGEGWFTAGVVGLAVGASWAGSGSQRGPAALRVAALAFAAGMVIRTLSTFWLDVTPDGVGGVATRASAAAVGASLGHLLVGLALAGAVLLLLERRPWRAGSTALWVPALVFLLLKGLVEIGFAAPAFRDVVEQANLRVILLHAFLLGGISLSILAAMAGGHRRPSPAGWAFVAGVFLLLAGLVPLTGLFPAGLRGAWSLHVAAWTSLGPVVAALALMGRAITGTERAPPP